MADSKLAFRNGDLKGDPDSALIASDGSHRGHFKTNFSVHQKEFTEETASQTQQDFEQVSFETEFNKINHDETFLHGVDTVLIPAESPEITFNVPWTQDFNVNYKFGVARFNDNDADWFEFNFSGVSCFVAMVIGAAINTALKAQIKLAGATTWAAEKLITMDSALSIDNNVFHLFDGLPYNDYTVRVNMINTGTGGGRFVYVGYTTYMVQNSAIQYYSRTLALGEQTTTSFLSNVVTVTGHGYANGNRIQFIDGGNLPAQLDTLTEYYIIQKTTNTFKVSLTEAGSPVTFSDEASPTAVKTHFSVGNCPPTTMLLTGGWTTKGGSSTLSWNTYHHEAVTSTDDGSYVEFKFYGSKIWVNSHWGTDRDVDIDVFIDGSQSKVNFTDFNLDTGAFAPLTNQSWIRLDDISNPLTEGFHTVKLLAASLTTDNFRVNGFAFYSRDTTTDTTVKRSMICGKESFTVGVDEPGFTFSAGWDGLQAQPTSFLRRFNFHTAGPGNNVTYLTPNNSNLKAIYFMSTAGTAISELEFTLTSGISLLRRRLGMSVINPTANNIFIIYDKQLDGDLHNKTLKVETLISKQISIEGLIFEIGNPVDNESIFCMPKWTRFNNSKNPQCPVSITQRLDVFGDRVDLRSGRKPLIHSGWMKGDLTDTFYRHGLGMISAYSFGDQVVTATPSDQHAHTQLENGAGGSTQLNWSRIADKDPGLGRWFFKTAAGNTFPWHKVFHILSRVV